MNNKELRDSKSRNIPLYHLLRHSKKTKNKVLLNEELLCYFSSSFVNPGKKERRIFTKRTRKIKVVRRAGLFILLQKLFINATPSSV